GFSVNLAYARRRRNELPQAEEALRQAEALLAPLARERPDDPELRGNLANVVLNRGQVALQAGRLAEAHTHLEASLARWEGLRRAQPRDAFAATGLGE